MYLKASGRSIPDLTQKLVHNNPGARPVNSALKSGGAFSAKRARVFEIPGLQCVLQSSVIVVSTERLAAISWGCRPTEDGDVWWVGGERPIVYSDN